MPLLVAQQPSQGLPLPSALLTVQATCLKLLHTLPDSIVYYRSDLSPIAAAATGAAAVGRCWGKDSDKSSPTDPNLKFSSISAGGYQTCGLLLENSTIRCYSNPSYIFSYAGYDTVGQYTQVVSGGGNLCALHVNGSVICWGVSVYGMLNVPALSLPATQLFAGAYHSSALLSDGSLVVWGGIGFEVGQSNVPAGKKWRTVAMFNLHACGITTENSMLCWGQDTDGSVDGVPQYITSWSAVAVGGFFSCGLSAAEIIATCWGKNDLSQLNVP